MIDDADAAMGLLMAKVEVLPNGCWMWRGGRSEGYGHLIVEGRRWRTHRLSYTLHKGPIPEGKLLRHTCNFRPCCNPEHLEPGTASENWDDAIKAYRVPAWLGKRNRPRLTGIEPQDQQGLTG